MHNSTSTQNVLKVSSLVTEYLWVQFEYYSHYSQRLRSVLSMQEKPPWVTKMQAPPDPAGEDYRVPPGFPSWWIGSRFLCLRTPSIVLGVSGLEFRSFWSHSFTRCLFRPRKILDLQLDASYRDLQRLSLKIAFTVHVHGSRPRYTRGMRNVCTRFELWHSLITSYRCTSPDRMNMDDGQRNVGLVSNSVSSGGLHNAHNNCISGLQKPSRSSLLLVRSFLRVWWRFGRRWPSRRRSVQSSRRGAGSSWRSDSRAPSATTRASAARPPTSARRPTDCPADSRRTWRSRPSWSTTASGWNEGR